MHLILTGATGLCGSAVLDAMVRSEDVTKISILSRRPVKMAEDLRDPRIDVILHEDFEKYDRGLLDRLEGARGCVWALGISQSQVGKEEYVKITKDYPVRAAEAFRSLATSSAEQQPFHFVYVSGEGATVRPGRLTPYFGRIKGEAEVALSKMSSQSSSSGASSGSGPEQSAPTTPTPGRLRATSVRPGFIDAHGHGAIEAYAPARAGATAAMEAVLGPVLRCCWRGAVAETAPLGRFLTEVAAGRWEGRLVPGAGGGAGGGGGRLVPGAEGGEDVGGMSVVPNVAWKRLAGV